VLSLRARVARATFGGLVRQLRRFRERDTGPVTGDSPPELFEAGALQVRESLDLLTQANLLPLGVDEVRADGTPVPTWWFSNDRPTEGRVVLYLHGGAYVAGSHATHRWLAAAFVKGGHARALLPDYRLAPEHRFPAALDDALATYRWLVEQERADPARVVLAGDSAGGGLAVALAVAARDEGLPLPAGLALLSPWVDLTGSGASVVDNDHHDIWLDGSLIEPAGRLYAPDDPGHPLASPLFADLHGLPPMLVHVGTHEVLFDDARRLVTRARQHGVDASVGEFDGMWHVFQAIPGLPEGARSLRELGAFVRRVTSAPVPADTAAR
jgi:acetyl esterase/lipase